MSVGHHDYRRVPEETVRIVKATLRTSNKYVVLRDELGPLYEDEAFGQLFCSQGAESVPPGLVAQLLVIQYLENLSDRAVMEQLPMRLDWKYFLGLPLTHPGFDYSVLSEFRRRLTAQASVELLLERVLALSEAAGLLKRRGRQRSDSTHILAAVRSLNRPELVGESLRHALDALASEAPQWVQTVAPAEWYVRYGQRIEAYRLPKTPAALAAWMEQVGRDGRQLLAALAQ